jgi:penicillin-binding protein 1A
MKDLSKAFFQKILSLDYQPTRGKVAIAAVILSLFTASIFVFVVSISSGSKKDEVSKLIKSKNIHHHLLTKNPPQRQIDANGHLYNSSAMNNYHDKDFNNLLEYPKFLSSSLIYFEESDYYKDSSVMSMAFKSFFRALVSGGKYGGSGFSQQLSRSLIDLGDKPSFPGSIFHKAQEIAIAQSVTSTFGDLYSKGNESKDKLLLGYMNNVYLGVNIYGFRDAARVYFGSDIKGLSIAKQATLIAMLSQPTAYSCKSSNIQKRKISYLKKVRNLVLDKAAANKLISKKQADQAKLEDINFKDYKCNGIEETPHFSRKVDLETKRLNIRTSLPINISGSIATRTTLDSKSQRVADSVLSRNIKAFSSYGIKSGAIIKMEISTGKIRAMASIGEKSHFNNATQANRQPGSSFKLITYITALEQGISPKTLFSCNASQWGKTKLAGCNSFSQPIDLFDAVAYSENQVAWQVAQKVGMPKVIDMAHRFGFAGKLNPDYGTVIGQNETSVTPMQMIRAYGAVANHGVMPEVQYIEHVFDTTTCKDSSLYQNCKVLYKYQPSSKRVITSEVADEMDLLLQGVIQKGTGKLADLGLPHSAGKTGTNGVSNDSRDLWFVGYDRDENTIVLVWLGSGVKKGDVIRSEDLSSNVKGHLAAKVWKEFMQETIPKERLIKLKSSKSKDSKDSKKEQKGGVDKALPKN